MVPDSGPPETTQSDVPSAPSGEGLETAATEGLAQDDDRQIIEDLRGRVAELEDQVRRTLADLDNLRKRTAREAEQTRERAQADVAAAWLPVVDHLDLALQHADADAGAVIAGVDAVRQEAVDLLTRLGYPRRGEVGQRFDPAVHEAAGAVETLDAESGTVVQVLRPGYGDGTRQLRPARVIVARSPLAHDEAETG